MRKILPRLLVSAFFIGLLVYFMKDDFPKIVSVIKEIDLKLYLIALVIFFSTVLVLAYRLQMIFTAENAPIPLSESLNITFVGYFFNNFLPTAVGGDIVKAMCATRVTGQPVKSVTSILMDRIFGLFTFIMIPSISFLFFHTSDNQFVPIIIYSFLFFSILCFVLLFNRGIARKFSFVETILNKIKLGDKVRKVYDGLHVFKHRKLLMLKAMILSVLGQGISIYVIYLMAVSLGAKTNVVYFYLLVPVIHLISMLPSLNGLGIREGAYVYFLKEYIGKEHAMALGILWLSVLLILSVIGAVIYILRQDYHIRFKEAKPATELL